MSWPLKPSRSTPLYVDWFPAPPGPPDLVKCTMIIGFYTGMIYQFNGPRTTTLDGLSLPLDTYLYDRQSCEIFLRWWDHGPRHTWGAGPTRRDTWTGGYNRVFLSSES